MVTMPRSKHPNLFAAARSSLACGISLTLFTAAAGIALSAAGCGLSFADIRLPTRPDSVSLGNDPGNATDPPINASAPTSCAALGPAGDANRLRMQELINDYRRQNGLNALNYSTTLQRAADDFALRMYREDFFDHTAPDGSQPGDRAIAAGFCDAIVGENIAYGLNQLRSAEETMTGFKNSPGHNANMLRERWDYIGVGYLHITSLQGNEYWWVQLFGTNHNANPSITTSQTTPGDASR